MSVAFEIIIFVMGSIFGWALGDKIRDKLDNEGGESVSNRKTGTDFEREFAHLLADSGFWVLRVPQTPAGQPFDIIAARNGKSYPIDCKVCQNDYFRFERIEENQEHAMEMWNHRNPRHSGWFALKLSDGTIWMLQMKTIKHMMRDGVRTLTSDMIRTECFTLKEWVQIY